VKFPVLLSINTSVCFYVIFIKTWGNRCQPVLQDHVCKDTVPIIEAEITHIPSHGGSDWCDLPNIVVRLSDGHSQRNSTTVAVTTVGALIYYIVIMQCSELFKLESLSLPTLNILLCVPFTVDNSVII